MKGAGQPASSLEGFMKIYGEGVVVDLRIPEVENQVVHDFADGPFDTVDPYFIERYGDGETKKPEAPKAVAPKARGKK